MYDLAVQEDQGTAYLLLSQKKGTAPPELGKIYQYDQAFSPFKLPADGSIRIPLTDSDRGRYYYARADLSGGDLAVSSPPVWVKPRSIPLPRTGWLVATFRSEENEPLDARYTLTADRTVISGSAGEPVEVAEGNWTLQASNAGYLAAVVKVQVHAGSRDKPEEVSIVLPRVPPEATILTVRFFRSNSELTNVEYTVVSPRTTRPLQGRSGKRLKLPGIDSKWMISASTLDVSQKIQIQRGQENSVRIDVPPTPPLAPTGISSQTPPPSPFRILSVSPNDVQKGNAILTIKGDGLDKVQWISFSPSDIAAGPLRVGSPTDLTVEIDASKATLGSHSIKVTGTDGSDILQKAFTVVAVVEPSKPVLPPFKDALRTVLSKFKGRDDFHFGSQIKQAKLSNARYKAKVPSFETVVALVDVTVLGGAGRAFVFGERGVYYNSNWGSYKLTYSEFALQEITTIEDKISIGKSRFGLAGSSLKVEDMLEILKAVQGLALQYRQADALK
jgi:hypothetical protein